MHKFLFIIPLVLGLTGCDSAVRDELVNEQQKSHDYWAGLKAAEQTAPHVQEFLRLFPGAHVKYRYFDSSGAPGFDIDVDLHGRYELTMQLPVIFDVAGRVVVGYGEPKCYLNEVSSCTEKNGQVTISYNSSGQRDFGGAEWQKIVAAKGDFGAIGYSMKIGQPTPGFKDRKVVHESAAE